MSISKLSLTKYSYFTVDFRYTFNYGNLRLWLYLFTSFIILSFSEILYISDNEYLILLCKIDEESQMNIKQIRYLAIKYGYR